MKFDKKIPEEYCKKYVNWRFFNYILDILTKYEDAGHTTVFQICFINEPYENKRLDTKFKPVFSYENGDFDYNVRPFSSCPDHEKYGLYYIISIIGKDEVYTDYDSRVSNEGLITEIYEKIKDKIILIEKSYKLKLVFKPK